MITRIHNYLSSQHVYVYNKQNLWTSKRSWKAAVWSWLELPPHHLVCQNYITAAWTAQHNLLTPTTPTSYVPTRQNCSPRTIPIAFNWVNVIVQQASMAWLLCNQLRSLCSLFSGKVKVMIALLWLQCQCIPWSTPHVHCWVVGGPLWSWQPQRYWEMYCHPGQLNFFHFWLRGSLIRSQHQYVYKTCTSANRFPLSVQFFQCLATPYIWAVLQFTLERLTKCLFSVQGQQLTHFLLSPSPDLVSYLQLALPSLLMLLQMATIMQRVLQLSSWSVWISLRGIVTTSTLWSLVV